jgi:hypothetical protein
VPSHINEVGHGQAFNSEHGGSEVEPRAEDEVQARDRLAAFRSELYRCLTARADALFELADAVLCADGPVRVLAGLSLEPEHRRGHGAAYDAVNAGRVDLARLRWSLACLPLSAWPDGRIRLAVDVSNWLRPGGSGWRSMSATGCGRARSPARSGCSATCTGGGRATRRSTLKV